MKRITLALAILGIAGVMMGQAQAGEVKVTWQSPEKYTDVRPTNETKADFQARVFKELDEVFAELAKKLPDGYQWTVTVTDVDLAGEVRPFFRRSLNDVRVITDLYWPRMVFSYELKDVDGKTVASGKEDVKDMSFLMRSGFASGHTSLRYEEQMLHDWFKKQQRDKVFPERQ